MNNFVFGFGGLLLAIGCFRNEFKKSGLNVFLEFVGFVGMIVAYIIH